MRNAPFGAFSIADIPYFLQLQIYLTPTSPAWIDSYKINVKFAGLWESIRKFEINSQMGFWFFEEEPHWGGCAPLTPDGVFI
jgi:hypothetical protein